MAIVKGQLGAVDVPGTGTLTKIYKVPASKEASVNVLITQRVDAATKIRLAHIKNDVVGNVANEDYIIYDLDTTKLVSHLAPISERGLTMAAGDEIAVYSDTNAVSAQVNGIEGDV